MSDPVGSDAALATGGKLGKYEVRSILGRGAMGTVLEAWDPVIDRRVAIKTVKLPGAQDAEMQEELQRFRREAQAAGRLTHPNIVGVFDYGETDDVAYIVMEFVDGQTVKAKLDTGERFSTTSIVRVMEDLLNGLQYSHDAGVIHRDIKPANLMLTRSGQAKIADFGIARIESSSMTQAGTLLGTPAYMSPEQFRGETVDLRTDIYSSGVMLYQLLTGERPFEGSLSSIMHKALTTQPPPPSALSATTPRPFDDVVARAMAKRPEDRFGSAAEFLTAIQAAMANKPLSATAADEDATVFAAPPSRPERAPAPASPTPAARGRSKAPLLAGGGAAVLVAVGVAAYVLSGGPKPDQKRPEIITASNPPVAEQSHVDAGPASSVTVPPVQPQPQGLVAPSSVPPEQTSPIATAQSTPPAKHELPQAPAATTGASGNQSASSAEHMSDTLPAASAPLAAPSTALSVTPSEPVPTIASTSPPSSAVQATEPTRLASNEPPTTAPPSPAVVRQRVIAALAGLPCTGVTGDLLPSLAAELRGFTAPGGLPALQAAMERAGAPLQDSRLVAEADPSYCPTLSAIAPFLPIFDAAGPRLALSEASGSGRLADGDYIRPRVQMPPFAAWLIVDYYAHDGSVEHIYPRIADAAQRTPADLAHSFPAGEYVTLGDPGSRHGTFQVGEPYGRDMIVAIASSQPLFPTGRPRNGEQSEAYARDVKSALDAAHSRGVRLAAGVMSLETVAK